MTEVYFAFRVVSLGSQREAFRARVSKPAQGGTGLVQLLGLGLVKDL